MSNRFKFRVWDSNANAYVPRSQFILLSDGTLIQEIGGEEVIWESTQPEFCTGLKDKNGKLIYEGDIVELDDSVKAIIEWDNDDGCWNIKTSDTIYTFSDLYGNETRVIGNIHQNIDLLEK